ncbi:hypothetical protein T07_10678 [Trichinella nelsoni]|uniref:Uncharacterized protein n=1 Tax=Trichinella nelsoni TaxID=6336 RepID=A0A0V0RFC7_9BILA|nr:hypothetical protein T07_10678 [Trichinella nelsoni]
MLVDISEARKNDEQLHELEWNLNAVDDGKCFIRGQSRILAFRTVPVAFIPFRSEITISPSSLVDCIIGFLKGGKVSTFDNPTTTLITVAVTCSTNRDAHAVSLLPMHHLAAFTTLTYLFFRRSPYKRVNVIRRCNFVVAVTQN